MNVANWSTDPQNSSKTYRGAYCTCPKLEALSDGAGTLIFPGTSYLVHAQYQIFMRYRRTASVSSTVLVTVIHLVFVSIFKTLSAPIQSTCTLASSTVQTPSVWYFFHVCKGWTLPWTIGSGILREATAFRSLSYTHHTFSVRGHVYQHAHKNTASWTFSFARSKQAHIARQVVISRAFFYFSHVITS